MSVLGKLLERQAYYVRHELPIPDEVELCQDEYKELVEKYLSFCSPRNPLEADTVLGMKVKIRKSSL